MYFTSDMPGGYGGADLYRVSRSPNGAWGPAENLGNKINTEDDEMFPFIEGTNNVLFFSSNGRFGLGGMDVFIVPLDNSGFGKVVNAGVPLNSQYNDYAAIADNKLYTGFFTSDRPSGSGGDDIYSVDLLKLDIGKKINGIAKDKDGTPIPTAFIKLMDDKNNEIDTAYSRVDGTFSFLAEADKNYKLTGTKENYIEGTSLVNTFGRDYIINAEITLLKEEVIVPQKAEVVAEVSNTPATIPAMAPVSFDFNEIIYFDLDKSNIRPDAVVELSKIVKMMNEYPNMVLRLGSHADSRGTKLYNQALSERREKASAEYLKLRITKPERVSGKGYGETELVNGCVGEGTVVSDCLEIDHQKNRRTEFTIVKK
jgi:outer membrane protein OmpA-like peptidoglycan-associated protein